MINPVTPSTRRLFSLGSWPEARRIGDILRRETVGGALLLAAALTALIWANSPWSATYERIRDTRIGPRGLHLNLDLATWAADGLLAIFFFVAGLELKRELVAGDLRDRSRAAVPVAAAVGGVIAPAAIYLLATWKTGGVARGWAVPTATDIAFALAVLAIVGRHLPTALRTFLLTLAVVDDLLAIVIIAIGYTAHLAVVPLLAALVPLGAFAWLIRGRQRRFLWVLLLPLAATTWTMVHASGVHATVAGVLLAFVVPVHQTLRAGGPAPGPAPAVGLAEHLEHRLRPISAGLAVPLFALLATGVPIGGLDGLGRALRDPVALGIIAGLVIGKPLGIMAATWLVARFTRASLAEGLAWVDVMALAICAGVGFTVSLLIGELAFGLGSPRDDHVTLAILMGSLIAGLMASVLLLLRSRAHQRIRVRELADSDLDGVPDVYQRAG